MRPPTSVMRRSQRAAIAGSCVTMTSVEPCVRLSSKIRSHHAVAGRRVEAAGRLVGEQDRRFGDEGAGQRDALLLAARQRLRIVTLACRQADLRQHRRRLRANAVGAGQLERQHHVLERVEMAEQLERLEHEADAARTQLRAPVLVERREVGAEQRDATAGRAIESGQQSEQRRLSGTGRADDRDRLARADRERRCRRGSSACRPRRRRAS